jgi:hypothetical protein
MQRALLIAIEPCTAYIHSFQDDGIMSGYLFRGWHQMAATLGVSLRSTAPCHDSLRLHMFIFAVDNTGGSVGRLPLALLNFLKLS